ncbi:GNAT family N-acetyltransferase [Ammoniphilus sp. YIM 78166]|uniref:GNAT family N-acetyltransferase n=1 Tax=Ammoniphilus sp. YIM 78166 TaxID=1644106 RepID=UPI00106F1AE5|nr:GNAT family N-acetyltransferase [Ammoniphilus sp. YIM 78166]
MELIFQGTLRKEDKLLPFYVRRLSVDDLHEIFVVQEQVVDRADKEKLQPLSKEEIQSILQGQGLIIGAFTEEKLVAFRALLVPEVDDEMHLGLDISLSEAELSKVIYQEISIVLPAYRGNQLQKTMAKLIMHELEKDPLSYRYVCCTVAPFNLPSLKDKFAQGMEIAALKEKYSGNLRYIFVKDLLQPQRPSWKETTRLQMGDTEAQQEKLKEGWRGFELEEIDGVMWVYYGR